MLRQTVLFLLLKCSNRIVALSKLRTSLVGHMRNRSYVLICDFSIDTLLVLPFHIPEITTFFHMNLLR